MRPSVMSSLVLLLAFAVAPAKAASYAVKPGGETRVVFVSKAPTESFEAAPEFAAAASHEVDALFGE